MSFESDAEMARRLQRELDLGEVAAQPLPNPDNENSRATRRPAAPREETDEEMARRLQRELDGELPESSTTQPAATTKTVGGGISKDEMYRVCEKVMDMAGSPLAKRLAGQHGLELNTVSWEDAGRWKNSKWGPCISDMTLQFELYRLPVVRYPNFDDLTWDVPLDKIPLVVGNEVRHGDPTLYTVTLREYLRNIRMYASYPEYFPQRTGSQDSSVEGLLAHGRDSHAIMSAQACFLPVPKGAETEFNVALFNPRSRPNDPAVLAIVATAHGTSCQVVDSMDEFDGQKLFHNKQGRRCPLVAQRLGDNRAERGVKREGAMTKEEKQQNAVLIIQIPLLQRQRRRRGPRAVPEFGDGLAYGARVPATPYGGGGGGHGGPGRGRMAKRASPTSSSSLAAAACPPAPFHHQQQQQNEFYAEERARDFDDYSSGSDEELAEEGEVEDAIVKVGEDQGAFREFGGIPIRRDHNFPIRATLQFYKSTATGLPTEKNMAAIAKQIKDSQRSADYIGSLVSNPNHGRPTENAQVRPPVDPSPLSFFSVPGWWSSFWLTHGGAFNIPETTAQRRAFDQAYGGDPSLSRRPLDDFVRGRVLTLLSSRGGRYPPGQPYPPPQPPFGVMPFIDDPVSSDDEDEWGGRLPPHCVG